MISNQYKHLVQPLCEFINSLRTERGENVAIINQVSDKQHIFLSLGDLSNLKILKNEPMPVELYINNVLIPAAEAENKHQNNEENKLIKCFEEFEANTAYQLRNIKTMIAELLNEMCRRKAASFINDFSNGVLMDKNKFMKSLQDTIADAVVDPETKKINLSRIDELLKSINQQLKEVENLLALEIKIMNIPYWDKPKLIKLIDQVNVHTEKPISWTNGIDVHPFKNVYAVIGCNDGSLAIKDQYANKEINRVQLNNNSSGYSQNCLWSPSGNKIMISTYMNHSLYIYDEIGQKLLKSMENTYNQDGWGATWLSEQEIAVGYADGIVKFFDIDNGKEIGSVKIEGTHAWGMDCLDSSHLLVGDYNGSISNINWKNRKIEWVNSGWHSSGNYVMCLKFNQNKTKLLTSCSNNFVKLMKIQDQSKLWEFKLSHHSIGISWMPTELYVLAASYKSQLVVLNSGNGTKILEFNELSSNSMSLRLNSQTGEVFIGDMDGAVRRLKIYQAWKIVKLIKQFILYCLSLFSLNQKDSITNLV